MIGKIAQTQAFGSSGLYRNGTLKFDPSKPPKVPTRIEIETKNQAKELAKRAELLHDRLRFGR